MALIDVFASGPIETNAVVVGCATTRKAAIVDTPLGCTHLVLNFLEENHLTPQMILFTHSHWDHTADAALLKEKLKVPVYIHPEDAPNLEYPGTDGLPVPFPIQGVAADYFLEDGQKIELGKLEFQVIHTPGHTPGGVCFWMPEEKVVLSGDTLFCGTIGNLSFPTSSPEKMWASLAKLARLPKETRVIPGHGGETTIGAESWLTRAREKFGG